VRSLLILPITLALSGAAFAGAVIEPLTFGHIDWTRGRLIVEASGLSNTGAWRDVRASEQNAFAQLEPRVEDHARQVRVSADSTAGDLLDGAEPMASSLRDGLTTWQVGETRYYSSGKVSLRAELALHAWLRPALVEQASGGSAEDRAEGRYTGVVVDARRMRVRLALAPRLLAPEGEEVYGLASMSEESAATTLPVVWVTEPGDKEAIQRAGKEPLFVQATDVKGGSDLVVGRDDVAKLRALASGSDLLLRGRVVIVVDPL
jgi:hypothetical protein